jgi:hypothetical protein
VNASKRRHPRETLGKSIGERRNAVLNYLYTLLEVETRMALTVRGLDPGLALFYADEANRQSLAADVMEPVRPHVDAFVLNLARTRTFSAKDFAETREGACRLASSLAPNVRQRRRFLRKRKRTNGGLPSFQPQPLTNRNARNQALSRNSTIPLQHAEVLCLLVTQFSPRSNFIEPFDPRARYAKRRGRVPIARLPTCLLYRSDIGSLQH